MSINKISTDWLSLKLVFIFSISNNPLFIIPSFTFLFKSHLFIIIISSYIREANNIIKILIISNNIKTIFHSSLMSFPIISINFEIELPND